MSSSANARVCDFYLRNACNRGDKCPYKHQKPSQKAAPAQVCYHFLKGTCTYGSKCIRSHQKPWSSKGKSSPKPANQQKPANSSKKTPPVAEETKESESVDTPVATVPEKSPPPCVFTMAGLLCADEGNCAFSHELPDTMPATTEAPTTDEWYGGEGNGASDPPSVPCKHYLKGECRYGDKCRNRHERPALDRNLSGEPVELDVPMEEVQPKAEPPAAEDVSKQDEHHLEPSPSNGTTLASSPVLPAAEDASPVDEPPQVESSNASLFGDDPWGKSPPVEDEQVEEDNGWGDNTEVHRSTDAIEQAQDQEIPHSTGPRSWYGDGWPEDDAPALAPHSPPAPLDQAPPEPAPTHYVDQTLPPATQPSYAEPVYPHISHVTPHWSQFADPYADSKVHFCKAHTRGVCMQGDYCKFRHSLTPIEYTLLFGDEQPNLWTMRRDPPPLSGVPVQPAAPTFLAPLPAPVVAPIPDFSVAAVPAHPVAAPVAPSHGAKVCTFYPLGKCHNGAKCPYLHVGPPVEPEPADDGWGNPGNAPAPSQGVCRFFKERGTCMRGDFCKYRHDTGDHAHSQEPSGNEDAGGNTYQDWNGFDNAGNNGAVADTGNDDGWGDRKGWDDDAWGNDKKEDTAAWTTNVAASSNDWGQPSGYRGSSYQGGRRKDICYQFQAGSCYRGASCRFSHDDGSGNGKHGEWPSEADAWPTDYPTGQKPPCALYKRGNCHRGTSCTLSHEDPESKAVSQAPSTWGPDVDSVYPPSGALYEDDPPQDEDCRENQDHGSDPAAEEDPCQEVAVFAASFEEGEGEVEYPEEVRVETPLTPIIYEHPETKRTLMNAEVMVGPDAMPLSIKTKTETAKLRLTNLSVDSAPSDISTLARQYGTVLSCFSPDQTFDSLTVDIEFAEPEQAYRAYRNLDNTEFGGTVISASLPTKYAPFVPQQNDSFSVKVSWPRAAVTAWAHYPTISKAKQEETRLNGAIVKGRSVKASFVSPSKSQKTSFAVNLMNLPTTTTKAELDEMCPDNVLVTLVAPLYTQDPADHLKRLCATYGKVKHFVVHHPKTLGTTQTAFITYADETSATNAVDALKQLTQLDFLGRQQLQSVQAIHNIAYKVAEPLFTAIEPGLEGLKSTHKQCTLHYGESDAKRGDLSHYIRIFAPKDEYGSFADLNKEVWELLRGTVLESDGPVWNDYFEIPSSSKALKTIQDATKTYIYRDDREHCIRVYGTRKNQEAAISQINKLLTKADARRHLVVLNRLQLRPLMNGGYKKLRDTLGANQVTLDTLAATLIVRGSPGDLAKAKKILDSLTMGETVVSNGKTDKVCSICRLKAVDPILLSCRHVYCTECLNFGIRNSDTTPYRCIAPRDHDTTVRCDSFVPYALMVNLLSSSELKKVLLDSFLTHARGDPAIFFCPTPNCQSVHRVREDGVNMVCATCNTEVCASCRTFAHLGSPCLAMDVTRPQV